MHVSICTIFVFFIIQDITKCHPININLSGMVHCTHSHFIKYTNPVSMNIHVLFPSNPVYMNIHVLFPSNPVYMNIHVLFPSNPVYMNIHVLFPQ